MVDTATYQYFRDFLFDHSGYVLSEDKKYLLESKLVAVSQKHGIGNVIDLAHKMRQLPTTILKQDVIDAMTINETFFFRDTKPFEQLERIVEDIFIKQHDRRISAIGPLPAPADRRPIPLPWQWRKSISIAAPCITKFREPIFPAKL